MTTENTNKTTSSFDLSTLIFSVVSAVAISTMAVTFLIKNGMISAQSGQQQQVVVLDALTASQALSIKDPLYNQKLEQLMKKSADMANDLAAEGFIVLDGRSVLRAPASKVILPEIEE